MWGDGPDWTTVLDHSQRHEPYPAGCKLEPPHNNPINTCKSLHKLIANPNLCGSRLLFLLDQVDHRAVQALNVHSVLLQQC
jgi:hypothetical protein